MDEPQPAATRGHVVLCRLNELGYRTWRSWSASASTWSWWCARRPRSWPAGPGSWGRPWCAAATGPGGAARRRGAVGQRPGRHRGRRRRQSTPPWPPRSSTRPCACVRMFNRSWAGGCRSCSRTARCSTRPPWPCRVRVGGAAPGLAGAGRGRRPDPGRPPGRRRRPRGAAPLARLHPDGTAELFPDGEGECCAWRCTSAHPPQPAPERRASETQPGRELASAWTVLGADAPPAGGRRSSSGTAVTGIAVLVVLRAGPRPDRRHLLHGHDHDHHRLRRHPPARRAAACSCTGRPDAVGHRHPGDPVRADHRRADQRPA